MSDDRLPISNCHFRLGSSSVETLGFYRSTLCVTSQSIIGNRQSAIGNRLVLITHHHYYSSTFTPRQKAK